MNVSRRAAVTEDEPFIERLLKATLADELMAHAWPEQIRDGLLTMQYRGRRQSATSHYPDARIDIIVIDGEEAGWLVLARTDEAIQLMDIALLPERRGTGTGAAILETVIQESKETGLPIRLRVMVTNRAGRLYQRLGFCRIGGDEVNHEMERLPH